MQGSQVRSNNEQVSPSVGQCTERKKAPKGFESSHSRARRSCERGEFEAYSESCNIRGIPTALLPQIVLTFSSGFTSKDFDKLTLLSVTEFTQRVIPMYTT